MLYKNKILISLILIILLCFSINSQDFKSFNKDNLKLDSFKLDKVNNQRNQNDQQGEAGPKVAFIPFDYTFDVGEMKSLIAANEMAISMLNSKKFQPFSAKEWVGKTFTETKAKNIDEIIKKASEANLPVDYICHGIIFKSGNGYGLKVALYPLDKKRDISYYYRSFVNFYALDKIADEIVDEMSKRHFKNATIFNKTIYINNFDTKFTLHTKSKTGDVLVSELPFIKINNVEFKKEDDYINELMLYNMYITRICKVKTSNIKKYANNDSASSDADYIVNGSLDISKEFSVLTIDVINTATKNKTAFYKRFYFYNLELDALYNDIRNFSKQIILSLLNDDERKLVGEMEFDTQYGSDRFYCDGYYLGKGNQTNLLLPINAYELENKFYKNWSKKHYLNLIPLEKTKIKSDFFKVSVGFSFTYRAMLHPFYNDKFNVDLNSSLGFNLADVYDKLGINQFYSIKNISNQVGTGLNVDLENKYFGIFSNLSILFGEYFRAFRLDSDKTINLDGTVYDRFNAKYEIKKLSLITDMNILPSFILLPNDWPVRIYGGIGVFVSLWYNRYNDRYSGTTRINNVDYDFDKAIVDQNSLYFTLGVYPEFGLMYKFLRFNIKTSISYQFELFKYNLLYNSPENIFDTFNTNTFSVKFSFGYYIN